MRGQPRISGVYNMANAEPPRGAEAERRNREARAEAWRRLGVIVVDPEDIDDDWLRQAFINHATKIYGRRGRQ